MDGAGPGLRVVGRIPPRTYRACLASAFFQRGFYGGVVYDVTFDNFSRALSSLYLKVFWHSIKIAFLTTRICLAIGYPAAYFIATRRSARLRNVLLVLVILPFWTDFLIRTYAWIILLNREGVVNGRAPAVGVIDEPLGAALQQMRL